MKEMPCELIEDLLPVYADELTSDISNKIIKAHLERCDSCNRKYRQMKNPIEGDYDRDEKEIDFLKKTRKKTRKKIIIWAAVIWFLAVVFIGISFFFAGSNMNTDYLSYNLDVERDNLTVAVRTTSGEGIQSVDIFEEQGVVEITVRSVPKSLFYKEYAVSSFTASKEIKQVWIGNRIIWANGEPISPVTANLYSVRNPYIGNMPSNGKIVSALNMIAFTGNFTNELQTNSEPYSWKMIFENDFSASRKEALEERLKLYAYVILAEVGNLSEVVYEYSIDGVITTMSITSADASEFAGTDIKTVAEDINKLEQLVRKTGFSNIVFGGASVESDAQVDFSYSKNTERVLQFTVVNYAEDEIYGMNLTVESGKMKAHQGMSAADGSSLKEGINVDFQLIPEDFGNELADCSEGKITLHLTDKDGKDIEVQGEVYADLIWGTAYRVNLSGNAQTGYYIGK